MCSQGDNEVHEDLTKARITRDSKDIQCILDFFGERKPFSKDTVDLRSLSSGVIADDSVNVDSAETIGSTILTSMFGKSVSDHKFSKKDQVVTLASSLYVTVEGEKINIDPKHLYQRLVIAGSGNTDPQMLFHYELCSYPPSLFDTKLFMHLSDNADLQGGLLKSNSLI